MVNKVKKFRTINYDKEIKTINAQEKKDQMVELHRINTLANIDKAQHYRVIRETVKEKREMFQLSMNRYKLYLKHIRVIQIANNLHGLWQHRNQARFMAIRRHMREKKYVQRVLQLRKKWGRSLDIRLTKTI